MLAHHRFVKTVAHALRHRCGIKGNLASHRRMVVATSGGPDSVALLRALAGLAKRRTWHLRLAVGHVNHHLRDDAEEDARFVATLARRLELPLLRADLDLSRPKGNLEAHARKERYRSLAMMANDFDARYIVTAHHADDQLETLMMRLLRGSSARGLACMSWRRRLAPGSDRLLIRPMLSVDRVAVCQFLNDIGQDSRRDQTNTDTSRLRARLRYQVVPVLRDIRQDASAKAVALADHMRQIHHLIEREVAQHHRHVRRHAPNAVAVLERSVACQMPQMMLVALLQRLVTEAGVGQDRINRHTLAAMVRAIRDHQGGQRTFELATGAKLVVTSDQIRIHPALGVARTCSRITAAARGSEVRHPTSFLNRSVLGSLAQRNEQSCQ